MNLLRYPILLLLVSVLLLGSTTAAQQTPPGKPLGSPLAELPGPSTWLFGQSYGNTTGAYNFGTQWYSAGQGLHFGLDISMPCGTPLVAMADGDVIYVDNLAFGAGPHNLIIRHEALGITALYGHLRDPAPLVQYQPVTRGQIVGYSGDPDVTCDSRPHLHLEVRSLDYRTAYNPLNYIDLPWNVLAAIGPFGFPIFQQDLTNPRQWQRLEDQPPVAFGGARLNNFALTWPPPQSQRRPNNPLPARPALPAPAALLGQPVSDPGCCTSFWWDAADSTRFYVMDGSSGQTATLFQSALDSPTLTPVSSAPPAYRSPDGSIETTLVNGETVLRRLNDNAVLTLNTGGVIPAVSADNSRLMWINRDGQAVPGGRAVLADIWVSDLNGANARRVTQQPNANALWLDSYRLLISVRAANLTLLSVLDTISGAEHTLGTWKNLREISPAPGGSRLLFYLSFQDDPAADGVYLIGTEPGATAQKLDWFGAWRWRDAESVYLIPYEPTNPIQTLWWVNLADGARRPLTDPATQPLQIVNGAWEVSPDGRQVLFLNAFDDRLWVMGDE
jgi:murein DD-endopeptidase MepM/ murein hydrolase activator NlpD